MRTRAAAERSFAAWLESFLAELRTRRCSESLLTQAHTVLPRLITYLKQRRIKDARAVTEAHLVSFAHRLARRRTRYGRPPTLTTQAHYLAMVRRFFAYLAKRRHLLRDPSVGLIVPRPDMLPRVVLSVAQARRLMNATARPNPRWWAAAVEARDRAILETLYGTGIRKGECHRLELADVDLPQARLWIRNGKGRRDRVVPIPARAAEALDAYLRDARPLLARTACEGALFVEYQKGQRISRAALAAMLRMKAKIAGLDRSVSPHVLRHSCATHLLQGGADVRHIQELLGHAQIDSTMRYTRVAIRDLQQVIDRAHPRERQWRRRPSRAR